MYDFQQSVEVYYFNLRWYLQVQQFAWKVSLVIKSMYYLDLIFPWIYNLVIVVIETILPSEPNNKLSLHSPTDDEEDLSLKWSGD